MRVSGMLKFESLWRCVTSRVWGNRIGSFGGRKQGWVLLTVAVHLHNMLVICNELIGILTRSKIVFFAHWMYFFSHSLLIHEKRMQGLRTVGQGSSQRGHRSAIPSMKPTHCNDICICLVHSDVVLLGPPQANLSPEVEDLVIMSEHFPCCHKHLEIWDGI